MLDYARNFGNATKEGLKIGTNWAACCFSNPDSWYSLLERAMIFLYLPCYGTMGLPSPSVFRALVEIAIRFFDTHLSLLIRFWYVIEVKQKKVVTVTSVPYLCFENFLIERYRHFCEKRETYI